MPEVLVSCDLAHGLHFATACRERRLLGAASLCQAEESSVRTAARARAQAEYKESKRKELTARRGVKISLLPMLLYFVFILAAGFYAYTRVEHGMGGPVVRPEGVQLLCVVR